MSTRLYLRNLAPSNSPTAGEKSAALPVGTLFASSNEKALKTVKGASQTSLVHSWNAVKIVHHEIYLARFTSDPLVAQTISANNWTLAIAVAENVPGTDSRILASLYVWRPSTASVVGYVYDTHTLLGIEPTTTEDGQVITLAGNSVVCQAGDVLVYECWFHVQPAGNPTNPSTVTVWFDGTTDVVDTTNSDASSYVETPQNLTFVSVEDTINVKQGGVFVNKPILTKVAGSFGNKTQKVKTGGAWV